jgi:hypothetical protein
VQAAWEGMNITLQRDQVRIEQWGAPPD